MKFFADLHIHSRYSRATSSRLVLEVLDRWARIKGVALVGTGDFTHPGWFSELKEKLVPAEEGLYVLSPEARKRVDQDPEISKIPLPAQGEGFELPDKTRFVLSAEISTIYSWGGRVRKVHHVILAPSFEAASRIQERLSRIGNLSSDGRPILGLDSRDLLEIILEVDPSCVLIPAHIWTPWFSVLGSKSGFDSIREAYRDLAKYVFALETGLSSDPPMNWLCTELDSYAIISNSDAHSPENLGREANLFDAELSYSAIVEALREAAGKGQRQGAENSTHRVTGNTWPQVGKKTTREQDPQVWENARHAGEKEDPLGGMGPRKPKGFLGTIEFFPQEGKYHFDGHRRCGVVMDPIETSKHGGICPVCGKSLTVGVMNRVISLADRVQLEDRPRSNEFISLIPLKEILSELMGVGTGSRSLETRYYDLIRKGGPELWLLSEAPIEWIERIGGTPLAEGIRRMRERRVHVQEGYDGEYGKIRVFTAGAASLSPSEGSLFPDPPKGRSMEEPPEPRGWLDFDIRDLAALKRATRLTDPRNEATEDGGMGLVPNAHPAQPLSVGLNPEQRRAVEYGEGPLLILAGPGTGKTNTLTHRIAYLLQSGVPAENILSLTFTHKAAEEMKNRLDRILELLGEEWKGGNEERTCLKEGLSQRVKICTFHSFGLDILKEFYYRFGRSEHFVLLSEGDSERIWRELGRKRGKDSDSPELCKRHREFLKELDAFDMDDLLDLPLTLLEEDPEVRAEFRRRHTHLFVDEYQDVNEPQYRLLRLLAPDSMANLTVIGDPDQAIYGFRGADVGFIRRFNLDYPSATVMTLSTSYRCPEVVLKASQQVLQAGRDRKAFSPLKGLPGGLKIQISQHPSDAAEAEYISRLIENFTGGLRFFSLDSGVTDGSSEEYDPGEIAVLCRTTRQMECLEKAFCDHVIPYLRIGERSYLQEEPASSLLDLVRFLVAPHNRYLRTLVSQRIEGLVLRNSISTPLLPEDLVRIGEKGCLSASVSARPVLEHLIEALGVLDSVKRSFDTERLLSLAGNRSLSEILQLAATRSAQDDLPYHSSRVILSTIHGVKGLEFSCVFIAGCEEGLIPFTLFSDPRESVNPEKAGPHTDIEEERRLFYVGMTRAKRHLYLSWSARRFLFGREYRLGPSSLLETLEEELLQRTDPDPKRHSFDRQLRLF